jgi:hypothetical protein
MALTTTTQNAALLRTPLGDLGCAQRDPTKINEDYQSCMALANSKVNARTKIDVRYHFNLEKITSKEID